jgi:hypothetical protein
MHSRLECYSFRSSFLKRPVIRLQAGLNTWEIITPSSGVAVLCVTCHQPQLSIYRASMPLKACICTQQRSHILSASIFSVTYSFQARRFRIKTWPNLPARWTCLTRLVARAVTISSSLVAFGSPFFPQPFARGSDFAE